MELLTSLMGFWTKWAWPILQLAIGLGLVIFVHELGHYLLAKFVGIKVERFALGFGPRVVGFKRGETDYCIKLLPLGGYVKMLGQEDLAPDKEITDPRAFGNKSIGARMAVVSAGVVMNVIFAAVLFVVVGLVGMQFVAPVVGGVMPDWPAHTAKIVWQVDPNAGETTQPADSVGLEAGDRITRIDGDGLLLKILGNSIDTFDKLKTVTLLADMDDTFTLTIQRQRGQQRLVGTATLGVKSIRSPRGGKMPGFGIEPAPDVVFGDNGKAVLSDLLKPNDRIVAVAGRPVQHYWDLLPITGTLDGQPVTVVVQRQGRRIDVNVQPELSGGKRGDVIFDENDNRHYGTILRRDANELVLRTEDGSDLTFAREDVSAGEDELLDILGMIPQMRIASVTKKSPAHKTGLQPGDIVVGYGDQGPPTWREFLDINDKAAEASSPATIIVQRDGKVIPPLAIQPKKHDGRALVGIVPVPDVMHAVVAGVRAGSPAGKAGIQAGDVIDKINDRAVTSWIDVAGALNDLADQDVSITYRRGQMSSAADIGKLDKTVYDRSDYEYSLPTGHLPLQPLMTPPVKKSPIVAIAWGAGKTRDFLAATYATLRSTLRGTVSAKELRGPLGIAEIAIKVAKREPIRFVYLMAIISVSLAVINFLPFPVVDGGLAVFLIIEKIRRRPLPLKVMNAVNMAGVALLLLVFVAVTWNDLTQMIKAMW